MRKTDPLVCKTMRSPIGELTLVASDRGLCEILWRSHRERGYRPDAREDARHPVLLQAERELREYFAGQRKTFDVALDLRGTEFQLRVWRELLEIPFGETRTYGEIARRLGDVKATRAVGAANGRNPVPIVAPCHRVIGASGDLVGFGGGLDVKAQLLDLERGALSFDFDQPPQ